MATVKQDKRNSGLDGVLNISKPEAAPPSKPEATPPVTFIDRVNRALTLPNPQKELNLEELTRSPKPDPRIEAVRLPVMEVAQTLQDEGKLAQTMTVARLPQKLLTNQDTVNRGVHGFRDTAKTSNLKPVVNMINKVPLLGPLATGIGRFFSRFAAPVAVAVEAASDDNPARGVTKGAAGWAAAAASFHAAGSVGAWVGSIGGPPGIAIGYCVAGTVAAWYSYSGAKKLAGMAFDHLSVPENRAAIVGYVSNKARGAGNAMKAAWGKTTPYLKAWGSKLKSFALSFSGKGNA